MSLEEKCTKTLQYLGIFADEQNENNKEDCRESTAKPEMFEITPQNLESSRRNVLKTLHNLRIWKRAPKTLQNLEFLRMSALKNPENLECLRIENTAKTLDSEA